MTRFQDVSGRGGELLRYTCCERIAGPRTQLPRGSRGARGQSRWGGAGRGGAPEPPPARSLPVLRALELGAKCPKVTAYTELCDSRVTQNTRLEQSGPPREPARKHPERLNSR